MKYVSLDDFFSVLGNKQRTRILQYLHQNGEHCLGDISRALKLEQSLVSHNMRRLEDCHFVVMKPAGKKRLYSVNRETVPNILEVIEKHVRTYCIDGCKHWG